LHALRLAAGDPDPECIGGLWFDMGEPEPAGPVVVRAAALPLELAVPVPELHAATIVMTPAVTATAAILTGLTALACDCLIMRTCSASDTILTSPATGEIEAEVSARWSECVSTSPPGMNWS